MKRLHSSTYDKACVQISGAAQFVAGISEHSMDADEVLDAARLHQLLIGVNRHLRQMQRACLAREERYRLEDPEGWERARSLGGRPIE